MATSTELSRSVERWRRRYLSREDFSPDISHAKSKTRRALLPAGEADSSLDDTITSLLINSSQPNQSERKYSKIQFLDSSKNFKNLNRLGDVLDSLCDSNQLDIEPGLSGNILGSNETQNGGTYSETDITLPSSLTVATCDYDSGGDEVKKSVDINKTKELIGKKLIPSHFSQIYHELSIIYQKLQQEKLTQQEFALQLKKQERFLVEREARLCRHEAALTKIRDVEEEARTKFQIMKEQHEAETQQLSEALKEKTKENKRLKTSFETLKELNDTLKKQRKHEFLSIQKSKGTSRTGLELKTVKPEKMIAPSKSYKVPFNSHIYDLLTVLMDWISDQHLSKLIVEEAKEDTHKLSVTSNKHYTQEKCIKCLPLVAEQLQWMPFVNPNLHFHVVKFLYWTVRQLDGGMQYATMTSTLRRLGEELFKGVVAKGNQYTSENAAGTKLKSAAFFKSCSLPLRMVSTLIIIKTVTQADYLAQAFDSLCIDLKTDEGKALFLDYEAVPIILSHIRISSKGLLSNAIDSLLQMTTESRFLRRFLEACSNEAFFRTCSVLLRNPKLDTQILEKFSILLQKLSKIKSNKKMFELFTIHLMIQELQRTAHPDHAFLCINLNSILFNLGLTKSHHLSNSQNQQQGALN
ncbi:coiled-coil domain-containing protein 138 isoform X4 [Anolis carolinensis]|uniref:coiled-coil domain-containing protein 138 isoform X4 n=1 Tax=Anolis carolinensis TaxID=28377 RepID=UPI002F2B6EFD